MSSLTKPVITWAGSKFSVAQQLKQCIPPNFNAYYEPFLGSAAIFHALGLLNKDVFLNDKNEVIVVMMEQIINNKVALIRSLSKLDAELRKADSTSYEHGKRMFIRLRDTFNNLDIKKHSHRLRIAAFFIFLVTSSFSGIYRTNKLGKLTSAYRAQSSGFRSVLHADRIISVHNSLASNRVTLTNKDFAEALRNASKNDFVYLDPPYFCDDINRQIRYTSNEFTKEDHQRLFTVFKQLTKKGCHVMLSYDDHHFIRDKYKKYNIYTISVHRNTHQKKSRHTHELLITNYEW
jgi:DNA adenine methylase